jgi:hypothetical protein
VAIRYPAVSVTITSATVATNSPEVNMANRLVADTSADVAPAIVYTHTACDRT